MKKILIPIDSADICPKTLELAITFSIKFDTEITVLHIMHDFEHGPSPYTVNHARAPELHNKHIQNATKFLNVIAQLFINAGVQTNEVLISGNVAHEICEYAEKNDCDLIIMCTHSSSATRQFLMGSITNKVLHHATTPVMIVR